MNFELNDESQTNWLNRCDDLSRGNFGVFAIDLLDDTEHAIHALQDAFINDQTPEQGVAAVRMLQAKELWQKLGDVPVNEDDEIEEVFLHFTKGTDKYEVWHWFEESFNCSITTDLMPAD